MLIQANRMGDHLAAQPRIHLSFCTNVFPAETFREVLEALKENIPKIKKSLRQKVCFNASDSFGIGLRLSSQACNALMAEAHALHELRNWLQRENCYVYSINGFPFGNFSSNRVKEQVYLPDWSSQQRLDYTVKLARVLADLMPKTLSYGSISTLPLGYKFTSMPESNLEIEESYTFEKEHSLNVPFATACVRNIAKLVKALQQIHLQTGKWIRVGFEPEPDCVLGSVKEAALFWQRLHSPGMLRNIFCEELNVAEERAAWVMQEYLGICLDTCHAAVEFEEVWESLSLLRECQMPIVKVQISSGLKLKISSGLKLKISSGLKLKISSGLKLNTASPWLVHLEKFSESRFLHQVKIKHIDSRGDVSFSRYRDLDRALISPPQESSEWRIHFHTPLFFERLQNLQGTADLAMEFLMEILQRPKLWGNARVNELHTEVETYTFMVLPKELRQFDLAELIAKELEWVWRQLFTICASLEPCRTLNLCGT